MKRAMRTPALTIELDGRRLVLSGNTLSEAPPGEAGTADGRLVTDLEESVPRFWSVETEPRYAELVLRKRLRDSGEFDDFVSVIPHWKRRRGPNLTDVFFTAVPARVLDRYRREAREAQGSPLLFPLYGVLFRILKRRAGRDPAALVFPHHRFADLIIASEREVFLANRSVAFDNSEEQLDRLWESVGADIRRTEVEQGIRVGRAFFLSWIDTPGTLPSLDRLGVPVSRLEEETVLLDGARHRVSLPGEAAALSWRESISPPSVRAGYAARRLVPILQGAAALVSVCLLAGGLYFNRTAERNAAATAELRKELNRLQVASPAGSTRAEAAAAAGFVERLRRTREAPSFGEVLETLSRNLPGKMTLEVLKIDYPENGLLLELFGSAPEPFERAQPQFQALILGLQQAGYRIEERRFDTAVDRSEFLLRLRKDLP